MKVSGILSQHDVRVGDEQAREKKEKIRITDDTEYFVFSKVHPITA